MTVTCSKTFDCKKTLKDNTKQLSTRLKSTGLVDPLTPLIFSSNVDDDCVVVSLGRSYYLGSQRPVHASCYGSLYSSRVSLRSVVQFFSPLGTDQLLMQLHY
ncbi:hypothetical protein RDABS01_027215 [Bienertia sinuspersici]